MSIKSSRRKPNKQLATYNLGIKAIKGDDNCLFRTISDQMAGNRNEFYVCMITKSSLRVFI